MYKKLEYYFVIYIYGKEVVRKRLNCFKKKVKLFRREIKEDMFTN